MIGLRRVPELWRRYALWYPLIGLVLFAGSLVPALHGHGTRFGGMPDRPFDAVAIVAVALQCVPLAVCRRWPVAALAVVSLGFAVDQLRGYHVRGHGARDFLAHHGIAAGAAATPHRCRVLGGVRGVGVPVPVAGRR